MKSRQISRKQLEVVAKRCTGRDMAQASSERLLEVIRACRQPADAKACRVWRWLVSGDSVSVLDRAQKPKKPQSRASALPALAGRFIRDRDIPRDRPYDESVLVGFCEFVQRTPSSYLRLVLATAWHAIRGFEGLTDERR